MGFLKDYFWDMFSKKWALVVALSFMFIVTLTFVYGFADVRGYKPAGVALIFSIVFPCLLFLVVFANQMLQEFRIGMNPWLKEVEEMHYWFNPMFFAWLYFHDRRRYVKWTLGFSLPVVFFSGSVFVFLFMHRWVTVDAFFTGFFIGAAFTTILSVSYYKSCRK